MLPSPSNAAAMPLLFRVAATFTAEPVEEYLRFWFAPLLLSEAEVSIAGYNQLFQELLNPALPASSSQHGVNFFLLRLEDALRSSRREREDRMDQVRRVTLELIAAFQSLAARAQRPSVIFLCPLTDQAEADPTMRQCLQLAHEECVRSLSHLAGLTLLTADQVARWYPVEHRHDRESEAQGHVPYTPEYFAAIGASLMRVARWHFQPACKAVIVDADHTLWGGVVAENGPHGITLGPARISLQRRLRELSHHGVLLALASKNESPDVEAAFARPEMILRMTDFSGWKISWQAKSESVRELAAEWNLAPEAFLFLDDNPVEGAEVQAAFPGLHVYQVPASEAEFASAINHCWALDAPLHATGVDGRRTLMMQQQATRQAAAAQAPSFAEFIAGLKLEISCRRPSLDDLARVAQLTQRTNQFNATGLVRSEAELHTLLATEEAEVLLQQVSDRFGDYGDVGLVIAKQRGTLLFVENFLLSCRVLGKGVEHQLLAQLGHAAARRQCVGIVLPFRPTERNQPVANFLQEQCADGFREGNYCFPVARAQAAKFNPETRTSDPLAAPRSEPNNPPSRPDYATIARLYADAASIVKAVAAAQRQPRPAHLVAPVAPTTALEQTLATIWSDVLKVDGIGIRDRFTDLGGTSLFATRIVSLLSQETGIRLPLTALFTHPTIEALAAHASAAGSSSPDDAEKLLHTTGGTELSPSKKRLWFLDQLIPYPAAYHIPTVRELHGPLQPSLLAEAFQHVGRRHPILRAIFPSQEGIATQTMRTEEQLDWRERTVSNLAEAEAAAQTEATQPFSLAEGPLIRALLLQLNPEEHWLVVTFHHIIADGWSVNIFYQDLALAHNALKQQRQPIWPSLQATCSGFAAWINRRLERGDFRPDLAYWTEKLQGCPRVLQLPTDFPHPLVRKYRGEIVRGTLSATLRDQIKGLAQEAQATPFAVMLAAFQVLLHRLSGQQDFLIGTPVAGRTHASVQNVIGCFVNTIALRSQMERQMAFRDLLANTQSQVIEALSHQDLPFENLVDALGLVRDLSHTALVQHLFVLQDSSSADFHVPGLRSMARSVHNRGAKFDLVLEVTPQANGYGLEMEFDTSILSAETAQRWLELYVTLLESACQTPATPVGQLAWLRPDQQEALLQGFNAPKTVFSGEPALHRWFENIAARSPEAIALRCGGHSLTYAETNHLANQLAHRLISEGAGPGKLIGLCLERSSSLVIALLAILKSGAAYLPIDLSYPAERLSFMLEDAQAPILITQRDLVTKLPLHKARTLCVDDEISGHNFSEENPATPADPSHPAYVIYTSGSTGQPKGCVVTHRNVARLMQSTEAWYAFGPTDVWTLFHSTAFDFSVWEIWGALLYGGRLVVVPYHTSRSPEEFYQLLSQEKVTVLNQTPSAFRQLIAAESSAPRLLPLALRYVIFGGEALEMQSLQPWFERHGDQHPRLVNMYGITETTVHVTYRPLRAHDLQGGSVIGVPLPDLQIYIVDADLQPVPVGVPGEMLVGGAGLALGYLQRPELTAQRFLPDHLTHQPQARLYRTGDLARLLPDGDIEYLGRIDQQVKIRGFRIELGEIENVLLQHPQVADAAVVARQEDQGEKYLAAYFVPTPDAPSIESLRAHLAIKLPDYMVPGSFVSLERLPLTTNGKLDQSALPRPERNRNALTKAFVAPSTLAETKLANVWARVLKLPQVGLHDNFFELGGDSVLSIHIVAQARKVGIHFTPRQLFENQTIAQLIALEGIAKPTAPRVSVTLDQVPLLPMQHWFLHQSLAESHYWNQTFLCTVSERLDREALEKALQTLIRHHQALRLRCHFTKSGWTQEIAELEVIPTLEWHDLDGLDNGKLSARIQEISQQLQRNLNYERGPLLRLAYLDRGEDRPGRLLMAVHHLAVDGVSWGILLEDLETAYRGASLPDVPVNFAEACTLAEAWGMREPATLEKSWWATRLPEKVPPLLPATTPQGPSDERSTATLSFTLSAAETTALLHQVPAAFRTQINDVLLTALLIAVHQQLQRQNFWIHLEGHGREELYGDADLSRTVGWFTAMFPVQLSWPKEDDLPGLLRSVRDHLRSIPQHGAGYGFLNSIHPPPLPNPPIDVVFNYLGRLDQLTAHSDLFELAPESVGPWHSPLALRQHLHEIDCCVLQEQFQFVWKYSTQHHAASDLQPLLDAVAQALREIILRAADGASAHFEPDDFPLARLNRAELQHLVTSTAAFTEVLPLSPMQELFLSAAAIKVNAGYDQWHSRLRGKLDVARFQAAWEQVLQRHAILRASFHSSGLSHPVQVIHPSLTPVWHIEDWSSQPNATRLWQDFLKADAARVNDLSRAPLSRFSLIKMSADDWQFLWSVPEILMDGWSWPIVFRDIAALMNGLETLPDAPLYRDFLAWLQQCDLADAENFWRAELQNLRAPTPVPVQRQVLEGGVRKLSFTRTSLDAELVDRLTRFGRRHHVTTAALLHAAWALLLARGANSEEVVFGTASSGRPGELAGVEDIVGPFVNNLPLRLTVRVAQPATDFVKDLQSKLVALTSHQHASIAQMQEWSAVPWNQRLFESLLVFQNYHLDDSVHHLGTEVRMEEFVGPFHTNYALTLLITPGTTFAVELAHQEACCNAAHAQLLLQDWRQILDQLTTASPPTLGALLAGCRLPSGSSPVLRKTERVGECIAPRTALEINIAAVWQRAFGLETISVQDNFFDLGGHSLLMIKVHQHLQETLGRTLTLVEVFQHPTIAALARVLEPTSISESIRPTSLAQSLAQQARQRALAARAALAQARGQSPPHS